MIERELKPLWEQLQNQKSSRDTFLDDVHIKGIRGISDLQVTFDYPVSVLAGPNGSGKSTILFALACAYRKPQKPRTPAVPSLMFPNFIAQSDDEKLWHIDERSLAEIVYSYLDHSKPRRMRWRRQTKTWNRSFFGEKDAKQPIREVYLHNLFSLTDSSEIRSVLQRYLKADNEVEIDSTLLDFAYRILPFRYRKLQNISAGKSEKDVLFVYRDNEDTQYGYSELQMGTGERAIMHLSTNLSHLKDALILIDEVETGLHPYTQQQLMLELQRLALRNQQQIIVTTHSPTVLEMVPPEGRIFLERTENNVERHSSYQPIIQKAVYGTNREKLSILCENTTAAGLVFGVFEYLNAELELPPCEVEIDYETEIKEFHQHAKTLAQFKLIDNFIFVRDGNVPIEAKAEMTNLVKQSGQTPRILFLPKPQTPDAWAWQIIKTRTSEYASLFGVYEINLQQEILRLDNLFETTNDKPTNIAKRKFETFCNDFLKQSINNIGRLVGRKEAVRGDMYEFSMRLKDAIIQWRNLRN